MAVAVPATERRGAGPGLTGRLALGTGAVFLVFVASLLALALSQFRGANDEVIGAQQLVLATMAAEEIDAGLRRASETLEAAVQALPADALADTEAGSRATQAWMRARVVTRHLFSEGLWLLDRQGRVVVSSAPAGGALLPEEEGPVPPRLSFSRAHLGARRGRPSIHVTVPVPGPDGVPAGRLVGGLEVPGDGFLPRLGQRRIGQGGYFTLFTRDRLVLIHPDPERVLGSTSPPGVNAAVDRALAGDEGWLRTRNSQGVELVSAVHGVRTTGWVVVANLPAAEADAPFLVASRWFFAATLVGALALLAVVWFTARGLTRPLAALTREVEALADGAAGAEAGPRAPRGEGGGEVGTLARAFDRLVEQRRRAEADLRSSEARFRAAFKVSPEPLALSRLDDGVLEEVNDGFVRLHGYAAAEVLGRRTTDLGIWVDPSERAAVVEEARRTGEVPPRDVRLRRRGGEERTISFSGTRLDLGGVPYLLTVARDVTEERAAAAARARLETDLRASEARHLSVVRSLPVVQWAVGADDRFTLSIGGALGRLGLEEGQVVGARVQDVYAGAPEVLEHYRRARAGETFVTTNDFGAVIFESHWGPIRDERGEVVGVSGLGLDVSERRRAEQERQESAARLTALERLAAMGRVAAGVAHEINNPLTYVIGALDSAADRLQQGGGAAGLPALLAEARSGAERVRRIVGDLRVFARAREDAGGTCDPAAVARVATAMVRNEIRHRARLDLEVAPTPLAAMPEQRLVQVLVNLLVNACHAIPEGHAGEHRIGVAVRGDGGRVVVEVSDTGVGMTEEVRARVFEPFFSTRKVGEGMGLGLALCQAMVSEAGGEIEVETAPGRGSTFRVRLQPAAAASTAAPVLTPAPAPAPVPAEAAKPAPARPPASPLQVLVVDDEPLVGRAVARLLGGHQVDVATGGAEALERIRAGGAYQVVVCDLMMPDMTGMDLRDRLAVEAPGLASRMIFLTGGAFTERARAFVEQSGLRVLDKPVDARTLRALVAEVGAMG